MTEQEWLACDDPAAMLRYLRTGRPEAEGAGATYPLRPCPLNPSDRKLRLLACGCWRAHSWSDPDVFARDESVVRMVEDNGGRPLPGIPGRVFYAGTEWLLGPAYNAAFNWCRQQAGPDERVAQANLLRCVFGSPWRPLTAVRDQRYFDKVPQDWRREVVDLRGVLTPTVLALARRAYDGRDWSALGPLADALEEAGLEAEEECPDCGGNGGWPLPGDRLDGSDDDWYTCQECRGRETLPNPLLSHLRSSSPHCRGCYVVDLILGKE